MEARGPVYPQKPTNLVARQHLAQRVALAPRQLTSSSCLPGVLIGVQRVPGPGYIEDCELPGLFHPVPDVRYQPPSFPEESSPGAIFLVSKQGKSWHYQLWDYNQVRDSNLQLTDFPPAKATDGRVYVVPAGGVQAGLCGQALLLRPPE